MKTIFYSFETKSKPWVEEAERSYQKKLATFFPFKLESIKSPSMERDDASAKKRAEAEKFLKLLKSGDLLVLFDENGKIFADSEAFAAAFEKIRERSPSRLVFLIGGAFGVDESIRSRAQAIWSLSALTMNHWVAQIAALEQLYRAFTISKGLPYHNR